MASRAEDLRPCLGVDVELLQRLFTGMEETISKVDQQEVILIVGYAGTGKSTTINYFLENPLEIREIEETGDIEVHPLNPNAANTPPVGSKMHGSQTFYPETYARQGPYPVVFCDTGGFNHTGDLEEKIAIYYAIRSILLRARSIKAVVIMYKEAQIEADRACFQLAQLVKEIRSYLGPNKAEYQNSLFLFFNECTKTVAQLKNKIRVSRDNLALSERLAEQEAADDLSLLLEREENIHIINPRDRGETREILLPLLHEAKGIGESYRVHVAQSFQGPYYQHLRSASESIAGIFLRLHQMLQTQREAAEGLRQNIQALMQTIHHDEKASNLYDLSIDMGAKLEILKQEMQTTENSLAEYREKQTRFERIIAHQCRCCPHCKLASEQTRQQKAECDKFVYQLQDKLSMLRKEQIETLKIMNDPQWHFAKEAGSRLQGSYLTLAQKQAQLSQVEGSVHETRAELTNNDAEFMALKRLSDVITHLKKEPMIEEFLVHFTLIKTVVRGMASSPHRVFASSSVVGSNENLIIGAGYDISY